MLRVLVTSGGTKVKLDAVRSITNMSKGTFGAKIATEFLKADPEIYLTFLSAEGSKNPFDINCSRYLSFWQNIKEANRVRKFYNSCRTRYKEISYKTYDDYAAELKGLLKEKRFDIIVLAAAVSDYIVANPVQGKVRSTEALNIELKPAEKLISQVKSKTAFQDSILVGFKLLVGSTHEQLIQAAQKSIYDNGCDLVIANDLRDIRNNNHKLSILEHRSELYNGVWSDSIDQYSHIDAFGKPHENNYLASVVAKRAIHKWNKTFGPKARRKYGE